MAATPLPATAEVWRWLGEVPDPEIPAVSLTDLGIVRAVEWRGEALVVTITPTYSGCPAVSVMEIDIEVALRRRGIAALRIERCLAPPWTTDWITAEGREKLRAYGIAPPADGTAVRGRTDLRVARLSRGANLVIACPRCGASETERLSQFGSTPCKATYRCRVCLETFDYFKCI